MRNGFLKEPDDPSLNSVSLMGLRLALSRAGKLDSVNAAVAGAGSEARIAWEYSLHVTRAHPLVASIAAAVGITDEELDGYFAEAAAATPA